MAQGTETVARHFFISCAEFPCELTPSRGPAKGYTEALEGRLLETEALLLKLVSTTNANQLSMALLQPNLHPAPIEAESTGLTSTVERPKTVALQRKVAIEYWSKFPLNTPEDVALWLADRNSGQKSAAVTNHVGAEKLPDEGSDRSEMEILSGVSLQPGQSEMEMPGHMSRQTEQFWSPQSGPPEMSMNSDENNNRQYPSLQDESYISHSSPPQFGDSVKHLDKENNFMDLATQPPTQNVAGPAETQNPELNPLARSEKPVFGFSSEFRNKFLW